MANYFNGYLSIEGQPQNITAALEKLYAIDCFEPCLFESRDNVFSAIPSGTEDCTVSFSAQFRRSIIDCLFFDVCWTDDGDYFGTICDICRNCNVTIIASGSDCLTGEYEKLTCVPNGKVSQEYSIFNQVECRSCGFTDLIPDDVDYTSMRCPKCGHLGLCFWRDSDYDFDDIDKCILSAAADAELNGTDAASQEPFFIDVDDDIDDTDECISRSATVADTELNDIDEALQQPSWGFKCKL